MAADKNRNYFGLTQDLRYLQNRRFGRIGAMAGHIMMSLVRSYLSRAQDQVEELPIRDRSIMAQLSINIMNAQAIVQELVETLSGL
jgi:hypothetical protein